MNHHVPDEVKNKWIQYEFIGLLISRNGKTYIRAFHKVLQHTHLYCFEDDWFWWDTKISDL
jgi:hypothetical protein